MTPTLQAALKALQVVRTGQVLRNADGTPVSDSQARDAMYRICRLAELPDARRACHCGGTADDREE